MHAALPSSKDTAIELISLEFYILLLFSGLDLVSAKQLIL